MRFSVFLVGRSMGPADDSYVIETLTEHALEADRLGYDAVFLPDHHFTGYAPMSSDPFLFTAHLAARTKNVHYGFSITTLPLHHPVRFAERVNLLDHLTKGKLLVGIGSGTTPEETIGFGVNFQDSKDLMDAQVALVQRLWAKKPDDDPIVFEHGPYKGAVVQRIVPAPYSDRHRLMSVALREASTARAATYGWPAFIPAFIPPIPAGGEPSAAFQKYLDAYREAMSSSGHPQSVTDDCMSWTTHSYQCVHVAETDEQAREELEVILAGYQEAIDREYSYNKRAEEISGVDLTSAQAPNALSEEWIRTWRLYGSPDTVANQLLHYERLGVGNVLLGFTNGPFTPERYALTRSSMDLFAREVMPRFPSAAPAGDAR
ncbi:LLM class flavin-dependent oxidoreductase [Streptomyces sp. NPDC003247]|uniref:LLM class flavin-dependent oxidoreductase n=1 Tax=Streptomyces sp. NPDC003247 TaxID=3364677 RepID=UPI00369EE8BF